MEPVDSMKTFLQLKHLANELDKELTAALDREKKLNKEIEELKIEVFLYKHIKWPEAERWGKNLLSDIREWDTALSKTEKERDDFKAKLEEITVTACNEAVKWEYERAKLLAENAKLTTKILRLAAKSLFTATSKEFGEAAVAAVKKEKENE